MLVWIAVVVVCFAFTFKAVIYDYYFLQQLPALSLLSAALLVQLVYGAADRAASLPSKRPAMILAALVMLIGCHQAFGFVLLGAKHVYFGWVKGEKHWADWDAQAADYIAARLQPNDFIYVVDNEPILYFLTGARIPTRYPYPPFLIFRKDLPNLTGIDPLQELDNIMKVRPAYVVKNIEEENPSYLPETRAFFEALHRHLDGDYSFETRLKRVNLYCLKARP
jgi:hypothetical protein